MKRILALLLALLMVTLVAVSCDTKDPTPETTDAVTTAEPETEAPTEAPTEEPTEAPTEEPTEAPTEEGDVTVPPADEETSEEWTEPEDVPYTAIDIPIISGVKDKTPHGYNAAGEFSFDYGDALSVSDNNMFIVTNDRLPKGKLSATFQAPDQHNNDNGIVFGMIDDEYEQYYFWEDGPTYYFLFVSDDANLYLAKVSDNGAPWTELQIVPIPNYKHGDTVTISVEFDGEGFIDCYANEEWLISYYDDNWTGGGRYGIRCEVPDVCYTNVVVDHDWEAEW
jgi:hypothetical protein